MAKQRKLLKFILIAFCATTLVAYLSFFSVSTSMMQATEMNSHTAHHTNNGHFTMLCCEMIGTNCTSLIGYVSEFVGLSFAKGKYRIENITTTNKLIFLDILSPPPKI
ncbi:MAG: hypothetical protein JNJ43_06875 [Anaerolineales bacterium]|nr:hypothetical protein [Anaerolineales bacterium]